MRPLFRVLRAVAALGGATVLVVPVWTGPAGAEDQTVMVGQDGNNFSPKVVRVRPGDTVTWQYAGGSNHNVTSTTANWEKKDPVGPPAVLNFTTSYLFENPGTYRYVCTTYEGMSGAVVVEGTKPRPTATRTTSAPRPTRTPSRTPGASVAPSASVTPSASATPSPSAGTARPALPSSSVAPPPSTTPPPTPVVAPSPGATGTPFLGSGGLTPHPATGRGKGLPVMLALLLIGGVGSAELRALLANAPR